MKNFYLTLISNSSLNYYPENKTSSFTIHLPNKIELYNNWEVAIVEIHYQYTFFNVTQNNNQINIEETDNENDKQCFTLEIEPGYYDDIEDIVCKVNDVVKQHTMHECISINNTTKRIHPLQDQKLDELNIVSKEFQRTIKLQNRLALQLGFKPNENILNYDKSEHACSILLGIPDQMLVYCGIIEPQLIGHEYARILRIIQSQPTDKRMIFGQACHQEFNLLHYVPILKKEIETISIDIRDCMGNLMPFQYGTLTVKLHFREKPKNE